MSTTRGFDRPGRLVAVAVGVVLVVYVGSRLVRQLRRGRRALERGVSKGEGGLRGLVRPIGAQLKERGVGDEDELDAAIHEAKRTAYERRYPSAGRPGA